MLISNSGFQLADNLFTSWNVSYIIFVPTTKIILHLFEFLRRWDLNLLRINKLNPLHFAVTKSFRNIVQHYVYFPSPHSTFNQELFRVLHSLGALENIYLALTDKKFGY